ncbi:MAG: UDP-N-acetylmuramoyl-tripeptide--D-alanyl-D-alanine ligase [Propionibacteriaceae bacterium]
MMPLTVAELVRQVSGTFTGPGVDTRTATITDVVVDSRLVGPGALFVALPGERVDGHDYVPRAAELGAVAALTSRPVPGAGCVVVADPQIALGQVARRVTDDARAGRLTVLALTGSAGKTTTKDLLAQLLEPVGPTVAPVGSFNNEIGLPLTACRVDPTTRFLVAEMGARGIGHIGYLCGITPPDVGLVLNVGTAHLGEFGTREAIAVAKGELVQALPAAGVAVLNAGDPLVAAMASRTSARTVFFTVDPAGRAGSHPEVQVWAEALDVDDLGRWRFRLVTPTGAADVALQTIGRHQVDNALAAAAAVSAIGFDPAETAARLSGATARSRWRMEVHERSDGVVVVNDAYNANPDSMRAVLNSWSKFGSGWRSLSPVLQTWALLGEMLELGDQSDAEHTAVGAYAAGLGVSKLVAIGQNAHSVATGALRTNATGEGVEVVPDKAAAAEYVAARLQAGDVVLVKASRGVGLETVAERLLSEATA